MTGSRRTQPYRKGARVPGQALTAMLRGRTFGGMNSADTKRAAFKMARGASGWPARPVRAPRPMRKARTPR